MQSLMMTLDIYIVVQRGPGNRLNRPKLCFLLVIVEIIRDCGQAGKEKLFFFTFLDCGPILSEGPPGGGREGC